MNYKILDSVWYTPPLVGLLYDALNGGTPISVGVVAIETHGGKWKCYLGYGTHGDNQAADEQSIAANGTKVMADVATAHFPQLKPEDFIL